MIQPLRSPNSRLGHCSGFPRPPHHTHCFHQRIRGGFTHLAIVCVKARTSLYPTFKSYKTRSRSIFNSALGYNHTCTSLAGACLLDCHSVSLNIWSLYYSVNFNYSLNFNSRSLASPTCQAPCQLRDAHLSASKNSQGTERTGRDLHVNSHHEEHERMKEIL